MQKLFWAGALGAMLVACGAPETPFDVPAVETSINVPNETLKLEEIRVTRSATQGRIAFERVVRRVEPVAERACREAHPHANRGFCDFNIVIDQKSVEISQRLSNRWTRRPPDYCFQYGDVDDREE